VIALLALRECRGATEGHRRQQQHSPEDHGSSFPLSELVLRRHRTRETFRQSCDRDPRHRSDRHGGCFDSSLSIPS
jgi:hypothetical protein